MRPRHVDALESLPASVAGSDSLTVASGTASP